MTAQRIMALLPSLTESQQRAVYIIVATMATANAARGGEKHGKE